MIWYPYEQMKTAAPHIKIVKADGPYLYTDQGEQLLDSVSSWWSNIYGYRNPVITEAITEQAQNFCHVMLGSLTHGPALELAQRLADFLPGDLDCCFFSDSGSVAVEVALKMAVQYYVNLADRNGLPESQWHKRDTVLALHHAYHGDTFRAMEVGDDPDYHNAFPEKRGVIHINPEISELEEAFARYHDRLNCVLVEPLLQGAGGMRMYDISFLRRARELCSEYGVLLIYDEVATGFGRTGNRFVADLVLPDIIVLGKALTGGYIGHAATVARRFVFDAFYDDNPDHAFMHGPTFMGNALACRASLAALDVFENDRIMDRVRHLAAHAESYLASFREAAKHDDRIADVRMMGGCVCIEVTDEKLLDGFMEFARKRGVFTRTFLRYMYTMFPYILTDEELELILQTMADWFRR